MSGLSLGHTRLRLHPLALLAAGLAFFTGARLELFAMLAALAAHELAHLVAAWGLGVRVGRVDLMPFGAAMHMENPYALSTVQLVVVSLAGPAMNALCALAFSALAWWNILAGMPAYLLIRANLMLLAFNLLPALPLDGGRAVYAVLSRRMERQRVTAILIGAGHLLSLVLLMAGVVGFLRTGQCNLTLGICAVFLIAAGLRERDSARQGLMQALSEKMGAKPRLYGRVRVVPIGGDMSALDAVKKMRPRSETLFAVYRDGRFEDFLDSAAIRDAILASPSPPGEISIDRIRKKRLLSNAFPA